MGKGPIATKLDKTQCLALGAELIHCFLDRSRNRAHRNKDEFCVFGPIGLNESPVIPTRDFSQFAEDFLHPFFPGLHGLMHGIFELHQHIFFCIGSPAFWIVYIQGIDGLERGEKTVYLILFQQGDAFIGMGQDPTVHADHDGEEDSRIFGDFEGGHVCVIGLLTALHVELYYPGIPQTHGILVIHLYADGR